MSGIVKTKKEREKNERLSIELSMKIGIMSMIVVMVSLIIDAIAIFKEDINVISLLSGFAVLVFYGFFLKSKCLEKVHNKEYLRRVIEAGTISSIFTFVIERAFMPIIKTAGPDMVIIVLFLIIIFFLLPMILFLLLRKEKEWHYYAD